MSGLSGGGAETLTGLGVVVVVVFKLEDGEAAVKVSSFVLNMESKFASSELRSWVAFWPMLEKLDTTCVCTHVSRCTAA